MPWTNLMRLLDEWRHAMGRSRLWRISRRLSPALLRAEGEDEELLVPEDFLRPETRAGRHFLSYYSAEGIEYALREYGVWQKLAAHCPGGTPCVEILDTAESLQRIRILDELGMVHAEVRAAIEWRGPESAAERLIGAGGAAVPFADRCTYAGGTGGRPPGQASGIPEPDAPEPQARRRRILGGCAPWLYLDWVLSQNPHAAFTAERPRLPGQEHPGAGIGRDLMEILLIMGHRLRCHGVAARPAHLHNAILYRLHYRFEDPAIDGRLLAAMDAMEEAGLSLGDASFAAEQGRLRRRADGSTLVWEPALMLAPLVPEAEFQDDAWEQAAERARVVEPLYFAPPGG